MIKKIKNKVSENNIIKNSIIIMYGQTIASLIGFINTFLIINAIGVYGNGVIAIIASYAGLFNGLFNFQSYNAVIKFGAEALANNDLLKYKKYLKQAFVQDVVTALLAFVVGLLCLNWASGFMQWDQTITNFAALYMITVLFNITGCFSALLRLNNEFKVGAIIAIRITVIKFLLLLIMNFYNVGLGVYIILEIVLLVISSIMLTYYAIKSLKRIDCLDFLKVKINFDKEFTMFNVYNNIVSTIDMPTGQIVYLIINKLLGVADVGIYNILVKLGALVTRITNSVTEALLPELSKMVAENNVPRAKSLIVKIFKITNVMGLAVIFGIIFTYKIWLGFLMPVTTNNLICLILYFIYIVIISSVAGVHLLFVSLNLVKYNLPIVIVCNITYLVLLYILTIKIGLLGIIIALIIQAVLIVVIKMIVLKNKIQKKEGESNA